MSIGLLLGFQVFNSYRVIPYATLLTCYSMSVASFSFVFGFIIDRCEYYGLPMFLLNVGLAVAGSILGKSYASAESLKLFLGADSHAHITT